MQDGAGPGSILGNLLGVGRPHADPGLSFIPDVVEDLHNGTQVARKIKEFNEEVRDFDLDSAVAFLNLRLYGQEITGRYRSQAATLLLQELDRQNIKSIERKWNIVNRAVGAHIDYKLNEEPRWSYRDVENIRKFNDACTGNVMKRNDNWYWKFDRISIRENLNSNVPSDEDTSFRLSHVFVPIMAVAAGVSLAALAGYAAYKIVNWFTSRPFLTQAATTIIPSIQQQYVPPINAGIALGSPMNMIPAEFQAFMHISESLSAIQTNLVEMNTLNKSLIQVVEKSIEQQQMTWIEGLKSLIGFNHSPR